MTVCGLTDKHCEPCEGGVPPLDEVTARGMMKELSSDWQMDGTSLTRRFTFKAFAKAVYTANVAAYLGDREGHHPDISFGWGYCQVTFTTHAIGGLSENDFICAAKLDKLTTV